VAEDYRLGVGRATIYKHVPEITAAGLRADRRLCPTWPGTTPCGPPATGPATCPRNCPPRSRRAQRIGLMRDGRLEIRPISPAVGRVAAMPGRARWFTLGRPALAQGFT
jgi:hypothetical protein